MLEQRLERPTVLVVDDEATITRLIEAMLESDGFDVLTASGSAEALKLCKTHPASIDILLTDLVLPAPGFSLSSDANEFPHVHGMELAARALRMRDSLRIVLMSGNVDKELGAYGIRRGSVPFVPKPFDREMLTQTLRQILGEPPPTEADLTKPAPARAKDLDGWVD